MLPSSPGHEPVHLPAVYSAQRTTVGVKGRWILALAGVDALLDHLIRNVCAGNSQGNVGMAQLILAGSQRQTAKSQQLAGGEAADRAAWQGTGLSAPPCVCFSPKLVKARQFFTFGGCWSVRKS